MNTDISFREGMMYLQVVKFRKRAWRKIWTVLFKPSFRGVARLEIYTLPDSNATAADQRDACLKAPDRKAVRLSDCISVTPAPGDSSPPGCTAFRLKTTHCTYTFASTSSQDWLNALTLLAFQKDPGEGDFEGGNCLIMKDNDLYSSWKHNKTLPPDHHQVTIQSTEASRRCMLVGDYVISIGNEALQLLNVQTHHIIYQWPYRLLRKFGQVEGGFSIEAGRRCESGQGVFIFLSSNGPQIFLDISRLCSKEKNPLVQPLISHRRSLSDQVYFVTDAAQGANNDENERTHSLGALNLDCVESDNIYYNVTRTSAPPNKDCQLMYDEDKCIYSEVERVEQKWNPSAAPPPPPSIPPRSFAQPVARPRYQRQLPVNHKMQAEHNEQPTDDTKETEEGTCSFSSLSATEPSDDFKQRLAEIISKDLAKFQLPLPPGASSPTTPPFPSREADWKEQN